MMTSNHQAILHQAARERIEKKRNKRGISNFASKPRPQQMMPNFRKQQSY